MSFTFNVTRQCQLDCLYCFSWKDKGDSGGRVLLEDAQKIIYSMWKRGHRYMSITGGEPFLHPQIWEILKSAHDKGFMINVLTNGLCITDDMVEKLSSLWRLQVRVSLEGVDKEKHEYFRGENTFNPAVRAIEKLVKRGIRVGIGFTAYEENRHIIKDVVGWAIDKGCSYLRVSPVVPLEKASHVKVSTTSYEELLHQIVASTLDFKEYIDFSNKTCNSGLVESCTTKKCPAGEGYFVVDPDGNVSPCDLIWQSGHFHRGSFDEERTFCQIKESMNSIFEDIKQEGKGKCQGCDFLEVCQGGCLAEKLSFGLSVTSGQPLCMKDLLANVFKKFNSQERRLVVGSWINQMDRSIETISNGACVKHGPFWSFEFKRRRDHHRASYE